MRVTEHDSAIKRGGLLTDPSPGRLCRALLGAKWTRPQRRGPHDSIRAVLLTRQSYRNRERAVGRQGLGGGAGGLEESAVAVEAAGGVLVRGGPVSVSERDRWGCSGEATQELFEFLTAAACDITIAVLSPSRVRLLATHGPQQANLPVPRRLPEFAQVRVHCIGDAAQPSHLHCLQVKSLKK